MTLEDAIYIATSKDHSMDYIAVSDTYRHHCYPDCNDCFFLNEARACRALEDLVPEEHVTYIKENHPEALI